MSCDLSFSPLLPPLSLKKREEKSVHSPLVTVAESGSWVFLQKRVGWLAYPVVVQCWVFCSWAWQEEILSSVVHTQAIPTYADSLQVVLMGSVVGSVQPPQEEEWLAQSWTEGRTEKEV